jgi:hypothetical protein
MWEANVCPSAPSRPLATFSLLYVIFFFFGLSEVSPYSVRNVIGGEDIAGPRLAAFQRVSRYALPFLREPNRISLHGNANDG